MVRVHAPWADEFFDKAFFQSLVGELVVGLLILFGIQLVLEQRRKLAEKSEEDLQRRQEALLQLRIALESTLNSMAALWRPLVLQGSRGTINQRNFLDKEFLEAIHRTNGQVLARSLPFEDVLSFGQAIFAQGSRLTSNPGFIDWGVYETRGSAHQYNSGLTPRSLLTGEAPDEDYQSSDSTLSEFAVSLSALEARLIYFAHRQRRLENLPPNDPRRNNILGMLSITRAGLVIVAYDLFATLEELTNRLKRLSPGSIFEFEPIGK